MCSGDDGGARTAFRLVDNKGERPLPRRETAVGRRWRSTGQEGKKEVTTWYSAYAYLKTDACLYTCLGILLYDALGTYSQRNGSIRYTTALGTIYSSKALLT